jgi:hypothetical protein
MADRRLTPPGVWQDHVVKVDPRALEGIERKIARADEHFRVLTDEMRTWSERKPWRFPYEVHDHGRKHFFRLQLAEPIPIDWAVTLERPSTTSGPRSTKPSTGSPSTGKANP